MPINPKTLLPEMPFEALSLPADDKSPERRAKQLRSAQDTYGYTYDKPNLRGIAMAAELSKAETPTPEWIAEVAAVLARLGANSVAQSQGEGGSELESSDVDAIVGTIKAGGLESVDLALEAAQTLARPGVIQGHARQIADFARQFQAMQVPDLASETHLDSTFARMRVAGPNPAWFRQVDPGVGVPDDFGVTEAHYAAAIGGKDTLADARKDGRLFIAEYRELLGARAGCTPVPEGIELDYASDAAAFDAAYTAREAAYADGEAPKYVCAPLALFARAPDGRSLQPVAIQLFPNGWQGRTYPVFTPRDGAAWLGAKACVQTADGDVHEVVSHLGLTHLVQEAFILAMHNCLAPRHPLHRLLEPHFRGTLLINSAADSSLVSAAGSVDKLLGPTIGESIRISAEARGAFDFNASMLPRALADRGVLDAELLPDYPYRDDALLVWSALRAWVETYVHRYYPNDAAVVGDVELQAFVAQVGQYQATDERGRLVGGGLKGVGEQGARVLTRDYLVDMVTQIIFNGSAQHAAVNFPQADLMSYAPACPLYQSGPWPAAAAGFSEVDYLRQMPDLSGSNLQITVTVLLGSVHATQLGHYPRRGPAPWFTDDAIREANTKFQSALSDIETIIAERNRTRPFYGHLRPSLIPQSIDI